MHWWIQAVFHELLCRDLMLLHSTQLLKSSLAAASIHSCILLLRDDFINLESSIRWCPPEWMQGRQNLMIFLMTNWMNAYLEDWEGETNSLTCSLAAAPRGWTLTPPQVNVQQLWRQRKESEQRKGVGVVFLSCLEEAKWKCRSRSEFSLSRGTQQ